MIIESGDRAFPSVKCLEMHILQQESATGSERCQKPQIREKVPAGEKKKNTRRFFAALASGDPVSLKRQRSLAWRCQQDKEHMTADIVGSDSAHLSALMWGKSFGFLALYVQPRPDLRFASFPSCCSSELDFIRLGQHIKPLGLRPR